ncbi:hypothetical protein ABZX65_13610 [Streptomyces sp. NPDC003300]|uniref:hypothetical protein n=2 Tax=Streptomyces TaxID=1883 RepID=UPI0033ABB4E6
MRTPSRTTPRTTDMTGTTRTATRMTPRTSPRTASRPAALLGAALTAAVLALALTSCAADRHTGALVTGPASPRPTCRVHQATLPDRDYTAGKNSDPMAVLSMLRYYTAQHALPYCDGKPASRQDDAWDTLYGDLTRR